MKYYCDSNSYLHVIVERKFACQVAVDSSGPYDVGPQCLHPREVNDMCKFHNTLTKKGKVFFVPGDE